ncbi:MAG: non-homologous end-joining DNA ligase [Firmicutes bacterium]|nr:non-homologous end-joining DNA ligase [Bacillota bacterium]
MLSVQTHPFDSSDYLYEIKWDGYRGLAYLDHQTTLLSRNQLNLTPRFPELQGLHLRVKEKPTVLDGEIVILQDGKPSFSALQTRGKISDALKVKRLSRQIPATFIAFDVLYKAGENVMGMTTRERKQLLEEIVEQGPDLIISQYVVGSGVDFYRAVTAAGLEGMVAKRLDSPYLPGKRSPAWKKVRLVQSAEWAICGWEKGEGKRSLGALILAGYQDGKWIYMGKVGTGFTRDEEDRLLKLLKPLELPSPVFAPPRGEIRQPTWVQPALVCEVTFSEISPGGRLRHPSYKGIRHDKLPQECAPQ